MAYEKKGYKRKLTEKQVEEVKRLALEGVSLSKIAKDYGVSRGAIVFHCDKAGITDKIKKRGKHKTLYKNLENVLLEKYGEKEIAAQKIGIANNTLGRILRGETKTRKDIIDALLEATGLTYEEAFKEFEEE